MADNWASAGILISKEALGLARVGDKISVNVTAVSATTTDACCIGLQTGSYGNFAAVGNVAMGSASLPAKAEFTITDDMLTELQANGVHITGIGYTLTSVDIIDPDCEYDITSTFDTADIIAWETTDGTPNLNVTITNFSLQDNTDGPHLNISPYNLLTNVAAADKQYSINQFKGHAAADNWGTTYMTFFQHYIDAGTPLTIPDPVTVCWK